MPQGDRGSTVTQLQEYLNANGANLKVDGIWGPLTQTAFDTYDGASFGTGSDPESLPTEESTEARFADLPGRPEVWQDSTTGETYMVYFVPDSDPELPMLWKVPDPDLLKAYFGDDEIVYDRIADTATIDAAGGDMFGDVDEIALRGDNPFNNWAQAVEAKKEILPWFDDPEVAALWAASYLEGHPVDQIELAATDWFMEKTQGEQQWLSLAWSSPETAKQLEGSNRLAVRTLMEQSGIQGASEDQINYIADKWTQGLWTDVDRNIQIALLADPEKQGDRDQGLLDLGGDHDTTTDKIRLVEEEARRWLGPTYGQWSDEQINTWAGKLRNDPDAMDALQKELSRQRMSVMPEYENQDLTYEDIASPWRNFVTNQWGQRADETEPFFQKVLQMNDASEAGAFLRQEGLNRGVKKVEDDFVSSISSSFSGREGVRGIGAQ